MVTTMSFTLMNLFKKVRIFFLKTTHHYAIGLATFMGRCGTNNLKNYEFAPRADGLNVEHVLSRVNGQEGWNVTIKWDGSLKWINVPPYKEGEE